MTPNEAYRCIEAVLGLPLAKQARCLRLAAEDTVFVWRDWCQRSGATDYSAELLATFDRWLDAAAADEELDRVAKRFLETLPRDLRKEAEPSGGYAGWALLGVAMVALGQCADVRRDILHTDLCYAAAAHCRLEVDPGDVSWMRLSPRELEFLERWWRRCCEHFPDLASAKYPA